MYIKKRRWSGLLACGLVTIAGCSLDLQDPNRPTEEEVFSGLDGLRAVAIGLQAEYGNEVVDPIYVQGLITDELGAGVNYYLNGHQLKLQADWIAKVPADLQFEDAAHVAHLQLDVTL